LYRRQEWSIMIMAAMPDDGWGDTSAPLGCLGRIRA
jgi:hypothetical protein